MANATTTSPAKPKATLHEGNIHLSIFEGPRITIQRSYQYKGKSGFANSIRMEDVATVKKLLDQAVIEAEGFKEAA